MMKKRNTSFSSDLTVVAESASELQAMVSALNRACTRWGMTINATKTGVSKRAKLHVLRVMVMPVLLYKAETWAVTQQEPTKLHAFQIKCL